MYSGWRKAALISQTFLLIYFQMCMWLPLGAWNDQWSFPVRRSFTTSIAPIAIGVGTGLLILATRVRLRWLMWVGIVGHGLWFISQAMSIWPPYVFGASAEYSAMYHRIWSERQSYYPTGALISRRMQCMFSSKRSYSRYLFRQSFLHREGSEQKTCRLLSRDYPTDEHPCH